MKIAIFSDTFPPQTNGVSHTAYLMAKNLADAGHKVMVFVAAKEPENKLCIATDKFQVCRLPSLPAPVYKGERLALTPGFGLRRLKEFQPDIIHTHTPFGVGWETILAAKLFKIPLVGTHHTFYDHYLKHVKLDYDWAKKLSWKITVIYYNFCDLVLSPSQALADALVSKGLKQPIAILRNTIDTNLFKPAASQQEKEILKNTLGIKGDSVCYIGRVSYEKSIDKVIHAFNQMLRQKPDLTLVVAGGGPEKENLEKLAKKLEIEKRVIFTGFYSYDESIVKILRASDIFITASKSENMPLSVLEAMAAGLPIISVREKGLAEIIKENINGFFARTDDPADLAQKTLDLLGDAQRLAKFGAASRQLALEHSEEKVTDPLIKFYEETIKKYSARKN